MLANFINNNKLKTYLTLPQMRKNKIFWFLKYYKNKYSLCNYYKTGTHSISDSADSC